MEGKIEHKQEKRIEEAIDIANKINHSFPEVEKSDEKYLVSKITRLEETDDDKIIIWFNTPEGEERIYPSFDYPYLWDEENKIVQIANIRGIDRNNIEQLIGKPIYIRKCDSDDKEWDWIYTKNLKSEHKPHSSNNDQSKQESSESNLLTITSIAIGYSIPFLFGNQPITESYIIAGLILILSYILVS